MKFFSALQVLIFLLLQQDSLAQFSYTSPIAGSKYHDPSRNIILRTYTPINESSLHIKKLFSIRGSRSGEHAMTVILSDDKKTILLDPVVPFSEGETVAVVVRDGIRKSTGGIITGCNFSFETRQHLSADQQSQMRLLQKQLYQSDFGNIRTLPSTTREPVDFPKFTIDINTNPAPGDIFYYNNNFYGNPGSYICIMSSNGDSVYAQNTSSKGSTFDLNHNGYITVYNYDSAYFEMWDSAYNIIDTYKPGNGYGTDAHEFQLFPNGHSFLLGYDPEIVDMTVYDPQYKPDATVMGAILQELDAAKNVIFEWRSWDHVEITEAEHMNLGGPVIDYIHPNAIEIDTDGNILMSCRVLCQVMKINRTTGEVMWRLGGEKNEYTFPNDADQFNYQHDIRRLANGDITIFDNGDYHFPPQSAAKEYKLDEINKVATLVWSYKHPFVGGVPVVSWAMGNAQRLTNGNTFINWGFTPPGSGFPNFTEVDSAGTIVWEMHFTDSIHQLAYRAHRYEWYPCVPPSGSLLSTTDINQNSAVLNWPDANRAAQYLILYHEPFTANWDSVRIPDHSNSYCLKNLKSSSAYEWRIQSVCDTLGNVSAFSPVQEFNTLPALLDTIEAGTIVSVFPNPAHDWLNCFIKTDDPKAISIALTNLLGQQLFVLNNAGLSPEQTITIPLNTFPPGVYLLKLLKDQKDHLYKVIVQ